MSISRLESPRRIGTLVPLTLTRRLSPLCGLGASRSGSSICESLKLDMGPAGFMSQNF
jgi:hypothetical protein